MKIRGLAALAMMALFTLGTGASARNNFLNVGDVRPGMRGVGRTVFQGSRPEEFQVEILGVMRGIGPGADAVLARFSGGPLAQTGVFEGMSGSPVFVDGKLLGAVAFSFQFAKEAVGGITPITQMIDAFEEAADGAGVPRVILKSSSLWNYRLSRSDAEAAARSLLPPLPEFRTAESLATFGGHAMVPIATPLSLAGVAHETVRTFAPHLRAMGLNILQGTGGSVAQASRKAQPQADSTPLEPGSNVVVPLIRGDMDASAGGTVTYIDGDRLYAFGHQLFNLGFAELPMHKGRAITVFPSLASSFKILETLEPVGSIRQDRNSGIYGIIGRNPRMIPISIQMTNSRGSRKNLRFEVARDRFLTPFLVNLTVFNSIVASERALGVSTVRVKGKIAIKGEEPVRIDNRFSSDSSTPAYASLSVALPVNFLLAFGYSNLEFERIELEVTSVEDDRAAVLDQVRADRSEIRAGDTVTIETVYRKTNGEAIEDSHPVKIPSDVTPGALTMLIADGTNVMSMDAREQGEGLIPRDLTQLIRFMNNIRKNDHLYVRLFRREPGAVVKGEGLPSLPPSLLSILRSERSSGGVNSIQTSPLMEYELPPSEYIVSGARSLQLTVKP